MKHRYKKRCVTLILLLISEAALFAQQHNYTTMEKTTLIVGSTPDPDEREALKKYVGAVLPLLLDLGGTVVKRSRLTEVYHGERSFEFLLIMDFPSKRALVDFFDSTTYRSLIPDRDKGFKDIHILFAEDLR